jgi:hypothetical protein
MMRPLAAALALALGGAAVPAAACTPAPDYRAPTNLELAAEAEAIVLARVVAGELDAGGDPFESTITIRPLEALKGPLPEGDIALKGMMLSRDAGPEYGMLSNPGEFERAHPVSYVGGCIRYVFPLGTTALFFLERQEREWVPAGGAFSRWAEDVGGPQAPWVQLVRLYLGALERPEAERAAWLEARSEALRARADDPLAQLMAADISRQLSPGPAGDAHAQLDDADPVETEAAIEAEIRRLRQAAIEAGN